MFLPADTVSEEFESKGSSYKDMLDNITKATDKAFDPNNAITSLTAIDNEAKKLQRSITGGLVVGTDKLTDSLLSVYNESIKFGGSFLEAAEYVTELNSEMQRMTLPSTQATINMLALSKTTGIAGKEIGKMSGQFLRLTLSQTQSAAQMAKIAKMARETGIEAKKLLEEVQKNLSMVDAFNFQNGVEGLSKMTSQAQRLGSSIDKIAPKKFLEDMLDPEKAIEVAANLSMLGGSIEGLNNPFQLLNDGANNVGNLQNKIVDMAKSAFKINEVTGAIETNNVAMMRLREQANAIGGDYEELVKVGRAAAKEQLVQNKLMQEGVDLSKFSEEQMNLVKSLSEVGKGGKIELRIPGLETENLADTLNKNPAALAQALKDYQKTAEMSDRQLAEQGLNIQETQQRDIRIIRDSYVRSLTSTQRTDIISKIDKGVDILAKGGETLAKTGIQVVSTAVNKIDTEATNVKNKMVADSNDLVAINLLKSKADKTMSTSTTISDTTGITTENDLFVGEGQKTLSMGKGEAFNFIEDDQAIFAPDLDKKLAVLKESYNKIKILENSDSGGLSINPSPAKSLPSQMITSKQEMSQNVTQTIDNNFNITVDLNVKGIPNGPLSDLLSRDGDFKRQLTEKIMDVFDKKDLLSKSKTRLQTR